MRGPDGAEYACEGMLRKVVRPERLVFTNDAVDHDGSPLLTRRTSVTFEEDIAHREIASFCGVCQLAIKDEQGLSAEEKFNIAKIMRRGLRLRRSTNKQ